MAGGRAGCLTGDRPRRGQGGRAGARRGSWARAGRPAGGPSGSRGLVSRSPLPVYPPLAASLAAIRDLKTKKRLCTGETAVGRRASARESSRKLQSWGPARPREGPLPRPRAVAPPAPVTRSRGGG